MGCIEIFGGRPLEGQVYIQGSKNAALPILAAAVLHKGVTVLHHCPKILDVMYMVQVLEEMGCDTAWSGHSLYLDARGLQTPRVSTDLGNKMRSSIILMGALLGRMKEAWIPYPGGCTIGARPIDMHVDAFTRMGASIEEEQEVLHARTAGLTGTRIVMKFPSVGATENVILAAALAEGTTRIEKGAMEPEIVELCRFLNSKGARIHGAGTPGITIEGVRSLTDSEFDLMPDRIVAGTYMMGAMATRGKCFLRRAPSEQLGQVVYTARRLGAGIRVEPEGILVDGRNAGRNAVYLETTPYPGFPTDLQSQVMAVLCLAKGESLIREKIFEARFKIVPQLCKMGAHIEVRGQEARIRGTRGLNGAVVEAPELRGGAALVIAGLAAMGTTEVEKYSFIQRGYEDICEDFRQLGGELKLKD
ncbi:MAG: UDP-N-acetylglucosamine 1-carboxyvinyltransferase [Lachnospiraceae bacterium]|nr:UDP-N-acetylglucosamine 1-carboxyvinyltransferase [Lachnospiraceae bacterium]